MGTPSTNHVFSGGRLIWAPTDLSSPGTNCGGTVLGTVLRTRFQFNREVDPIIGEDFGGATVEAVALDTEIVVEVMVTGWDEDFAAAAFLGASTNSGVPTVVDIETTTRGSLLGANHAQRLLWLPNRDTETPAFLLYNAVPWRIPQPVNFNSRRSVTVWASFLALPQANGKVSVSDLLANISIV